MVGKNEIVYLEFYREIGFLVEFFVFLFKLFFSWVISMYLGYMILCCFRL